MTARLLPLLLLLPLAAAPAQQAVVTEPAAAGAFHVVGVDETTLQPTPLLQDVTFLPVALRGVPALQRLRTGSPRVAGATGPAPHVRLPALGSLYRVHTGGATHLLRVAQDGAVTLHATTPQQGAAPALLPDLALSPDGQRLLLASTVAAGGDVLLVDLLSGRGPTSLTASLRPLPVDGVSLRLGEHHAWFVADGVLYRADLLAGHAAEPVDLGLLPGDVLLPELATSAAGAYAAAVVEQTDGLRHVHVAPPAGIGRRVTQAAADYDLPSLDSHEGPLLALSDDGGHVAFRRTVVVKEVFVSPVPQPAPAMQVTADAAFVDTIDNAGVLGFAGERLVFLAGEADPTEPGVAVGAADVFVHDPATGTTTNLTQTSGSASQPFVKGELEVLAAWLDPRGERLLLHVDPDEGDFGLLAVDLAAPAPAAPVTLLDRLDAPPQVEPAGEHLLVFSRPEAPGGTVRQRLHVLPPLSAGVLPQLLASVDAAQPLLFDRFAASRSQPRAAFVASLGPGLELAVLVDLTAPLAVAAWADVLDVTPALAFTPAGHLSLGLGDAGGPYLLGFLLAPSMGVPWGLPRQAGFPLEG